MSNISPRSRSRPSSSSSAGSEKTVVEVTVVSPLVNVGANPLAKEARATNAKIESFMMN